jgi:PAS domain S-box-containing protein
MLGRAMSVATIGDRTARFRRAAVQVAIGGVALAMLTFVGFQLHADAATAAVLYFFLIVLMSLWAGAVTPIAIAVLSVLCLGYFFAPPLFTLRMSQPIEVVAAIAFSATSLVITRLMTKVRQSIGNIRGLQHQIQLVVENVPALIWRALPDGSCDFQSGRWQEYTGMSLQQGLGWGWTTAVHAEDRPRFLNEWKTAIRDGRPLETEVRLRRADGAHRWFLIRTRPLHDEPAQDRKWYASATDIEGRRRAETTLREQAHLLDLTHDTVFVRDMNDVITYWNRGAEELYGWRRDDAIGNVTHQLLETVFPAPLEEIMDTLTATGRWEGELIHTKRDRTKVVVASRWARQQDDAGRLNAVLETNNDITERKRTEDALEQQANLLEQAHDAVLVWELSGAITYWNRGAEQLYGFSRQEALGRVSHQLLQTEHPLPATVFEAALERDGEWSGELKHTTRDGRAITVESRHVLMRQADGRDRVLETNRDISERRRAEEALREVQAELAHVARVTTMGEMAASIAHEVNQPLSGVVINGNACLRWLAGSSPNLDEAREAVQRIIRDGKRASEVIARIRSLSKKNSAEKEPVDLNEAVEEVVAFAEGELRRTRVALRTALAGDLPHVMGDRVQLQQVVLNLVLNGIEAMSTVVDRPRELVIGTESDEAGHVRVGVRDAGIGLAPENMNQVFDAFYTTKRGGMGMGLSISRSIIETHGGRLWAESNDGPGTTFFFTI